MVEVKLDITDLMRRVKRSKDQFEDLTKLFENIGKLELSASQLRFRDEEDPSGRKWPDPVTIRRDGGNAPERRERQMAWNYVLKSNYHAVPPGWHWFDRSRDKVLQDTGNLLRTMGYSATKTSVSIGASAEYAASLQTGRFPFIGISSTTKDNILQALEFFYKGVF